MTAAPKTIGIIGGLGPAATLDLFAKILAATPAERDQDHLRVLIDNNPRIPDRNAAIGGEGPSPGAALAETAHGLERAGADFIIIACNTAHAYGAEIRAAIAIPLLSMIEATADAAAMLAPRPERVGVLAADGCIRARLYQDALTERTIEPLVLNADRQVRFMDLVYRVKGGEAGEAVAGEMRAHAAQLLNAGAEAVIAGCTEVPLFLDADALSVPLISSTDILAARAVAFAFGEIT
jgi:aspartate racemase